MIRPLLIAALLSTIACFGCSRQSDTHDPDKAPEADTEVTEEIIVDEPGNTDTETPMPDPQGTTGDNNTGDTSATGDNAENPNSEGQLICNATWFEWVNGQLMANYEEAIAEQYPDGMPSVGSQEWFVAADRLTGGDGAHGPDGGSDEWCFMMQQRLNTSD